jgi:hypothetical protein
MCIRSYFLDIFLLKKSQLWYPPYHESVKNQFHQNIVIIVKLDAPLHSTNLSYALNLFSVVLMIFSWN